MIAGPNVSICDECVRLCVDILNEPPAPAERGSPPRILVQTPDGTVHACEQQTTWTPFEHEGRRLEWCIGRGFIRSGTALRILAVRDPSRDGPSMGAAYPLDRELGEDDARDLARGSSRE